MAWALTTSPKAEAVERALALIDAREGRYVVTPNPEIVMLAKENPALKEALAGADIVLPTARA